MCCVSDLLQCEALLPVVVAVAVGGAAMYFVLFHKTSLPAIPFELKPPAESLPGWKSGKILDQPSIFVEDRPDLIQCFDPATGRSLGQVPATTVDQLNDKLKRAHNAQKTWALTTFEQRRQVLRTLNEFVLGHQREICQVACRDSGKTLIDATLGE
ncbi:Meiotic Sister-Chromatid recombination aldehyde dehydrogenase, partial [Coemansia sp. S17]